MATSLGGSAVEARREPGGPAPGDSAQRLSPGLRRELQHQEGAESVGAGLDLQRPRHRRWSGGECGDRPPPVRGASGQGPGSAPARSAGVLCAGYGGGVAIAGEVEGDGWIGGRTGGREELRGDDMRILVILGVGSVLLVGASKGPTTSRVREMSCPKGGEAESFGPAMAPDDTGKVFSSVLSPDGKEVYFFKKVTRGHEDYRIYRSTLTSGHWGPGELRCLGGDYSDLYPALSPDGKRLPFSSYRPAPGDTSSHHNA